MKTEEILEEREGTHGSFRLNSECSQTLKSTLNTWLCAAELDAVQQEALDMICLKLSRIVTGNANEIDHWRDIAGYAQLVVNELEND